jgi:hypothetical protein
MPVNVTADTEVAEQEEMLLVAMAYIAASNALGDAILILKGLEGDTLDPADVIVVINERRKLEERYARNERNFLAFHAGQIAMNPPRREDVEAIVMLASEVAQLALDRARAAEAVALATKVADFWDEVQA